MPTNIILPSSRVSFKNASRGRVFGHTYATKLLRPGDEGEDLLAVAKVTLKD